MCINQRLLDQQSTYTVPQKQNRPGLRVVSLYPYRLEKFVRFINECILILPIDCRRVVFVKEDSRFSRILGEFVLEPDAAPGPRRCAPGFPSVVNVILASRIQAVDGDDATRRQENSDRRACNSLDFRCIA